MGLNEAKHEIKDIQGVRCSVVEAGISESRVKFLEEILKFNKLEVKYAADEKDPSKFVIGVIDILFNPIIAVYDKKLRKLDGHILTPRYWNQLDGETDIPYWLVKQ